MWRARPTAHFDGIDRQFRGSCEERVQVRTAARGAAVISVIEATSNATAVSANLRRIWGRVIVANPLPVSVLLTGPFAQGHSSLPVGVRFIK
jgi:hypothetical protein